MSDQQMAELYERLSGGKSANTQSVFLRGWNAAIEWAVKQMKLTCDEPVEPPSLDAVLQKAFEELRQ